MSTPVTPVMTAKIIAALYDALLDMAKRSGLFDGGTTDHEARNAPVELSCEVLMGELACIPRGSGLGASSGRQEFTLRVRAPRMETPDSKTERAILYAGAYLMAALNADFDLDDVSEIAAGFVRMVDVLGAYGDPLRMEPGWITQSGSPYRVAVITFGIILNDIFPQGA